MSYVQESRQKAITHMHRREPIGNLIGGGGDSGQAAIAALLSPHSGQQKRQMAFFRNWVFSCFPAGTPVSTPHGWTDIEYIQPGDAVLNHRGEYDEVKEVDSREFTGDLIEIEAYGTSSIVSTECHPFWVLREGSQEWISAGEIRAGDRLLVPVHRATERTESVRVEWNNHRISKPGPKSGRTEDIPITQELMILIGYFLAEGHVRVTAGGSGNKFPKTVGFSFHEDESEYHQEVVECMRSVFGLDKHYVSQTEGDRAVTLLFHSRLAAEFFLLFDHGARHKSLPEWVYGVHVEGLKHLLRCYWNGDGCLYGRRYAAVTASPHLAEGLRRVGMLCSVAMHLHEFKSSGPLSAGHVHYKLSMSGTNADKFSEIAGQAITPPASTKGNFGRSFCEITGDYLECQVRSVSRRSVESFRVFNFECNGDEHSYCVRGVAVHNCVHWIAKKLAGQEIFAASMVGASDNPERSLSRYIKSVLPEMSSKARKIKAHENELELLSDHPVLDLLSAPNNLQSQFEFVYMWAASMLIVGEGYLIGDDEEAWAIPSTWIEPDHSRGMFRDFKLKLGESTQGIPIPEEFVSRSYFPNPEDPRKAYSPLMAILPAVRVDDFIQESQEAMFERGIFPNVAITVGQSVDSQGKPTGRRPRLNSQQRRQLIMAVREIWRSTAGIGEPAILDGLIEKVEKLTNSPQEMDWKESGAITKARITQAYSLNPIVLGEIAGVNRAQAAVARQSAYDDAVNPLGAALGRSLTTLLGPKYDTPSRLMLFVDPCVAIDASLTFQRWNAARNKGDVSRNEFRSEVLGLPPIEDEAERPDILNTVGGMAGGVQVLTALGQGLISPAAAEEIFTLFYGDPEAARRLTMGAPQIAPDQMAACVSELQACVQGALDAMHESRRDPIGLLQELASE
jgi:phage portal protein BeeE